MFLMLTMRNEEPFQEMVRLISNYQFLPIGEIVSKCCRDEVVDFPPGLAPPRFSLSLSNSHYPQKPLSKRAGGFEHCFNGFLMKILIGNF